MIKIILDISIIILLCTIAFVLNIIMHKQKVDFRPMTLEGCVVKLSDVAERLGVTTGYLSTLISKSEGKGFVERLPGHMTCLFSGLMKLSAATHDAAA